MRPHRLRVTAFGAFAATEQVTFDDLEGLFLLHGETGAGKTTLLDAIAFALYGRVPGERGTARRLRSDHASPRTATEVELEATIGGRRLRITRRPEQDRPKKSGTGTTKEQASVRLEERSADTWEVKSARIGEADKEITDLIGMSAEQFFQVVLLPQGEFAKFLRADAKDKETLLQKLFSTDRFRKVEDWLADCRRATEKEVAAAHEDVSRLVERIAQAAGTEVPGQAPDPADWTERLMSKAAADRDAAATVVALRQADLEAVLAAKEQAGQLADRQRRRRDAIGRQQDLESAAPSIAALRVEADAAARAAEVAPLLDAADRAAAAADAAREAEARARSAIKNLLSADAAPETLRAAAEEQRTNVGRLDLLRAVAKQAVAEDETAATARFRAARLDADLASAVAEAARHDQAHPEAAAARDAAVRAATELPAAQSAAKAARGMAADSAALVGQRAERDRMHEAHLTARETVLRLQAEVLQIREARIDGMRAELAASMTDGSPCPVCGSLDHPDPVEPTFEPVSRDQEEAANDRAAQAGAEADKAGSDVAAAEARIGELANRLDAAGFAGLLAAVGLFSPDTALRSDPAALATAARQAETSAELAEAEAAHLKARAETLAVLQQELDDLDDAILTSKASLARLGEQRTAALAEADAAAQRAADRRGELHAQLGEATDLEEALAATRRLADALTMAADAADDTVRTTAEARAASERATSTAIAAHFGPAGPGEAAREAFREPQWRKDIADRIASHEAETEAVTTMLADPDLAGVALDPAAPVAGTTEAAEAAQHAHVAAVDAHSQARSRAEQLAGLQPQLQAALAALQPVRERAAQIRHLADLANGTSGANQYKMTLSSFVLAARLEEVAAAASERLLTMTAGRYSLVHSDARKGNAKAGLSLLACDTWTGIDRDTATLSGGETFLASLALALGLADVVTAESAGTRMEALFVDEGFGTLDEDTLDEVMNVLDGLRAGGRIVGIVSHVTELRQRIPARVHVRKGRAGSHVEITPG